MKKLNNYLCFGLLFNSIFITSNRYGLLPDFIEGLCAGVGIGLSLMGMYAVNHDISKFRNYKINFLKRCIGK